MSGADLQALLGQLPPGENIFVSLQMYLDNQVFPDMGPAFWGQLFLAVGVSGFTLLAIMVSFAIRIRQKRLSFLIVDGSCTRIDPKTAVPALWAVGSILQIIFALRVRSALLDHRFQLSTGVMWFLNYIPQAVSYVLLSTSVATGAPPLRRYLSRTSYGVYEYNLVVLLWVGGTIAGVFPSSYRYGRSLVRLTDHYRELSALITEAGQAQDLQSLFGLQGPLNSLEAAHKEYLTATRVASAVYAGFAALFIITGVLPAIILSRMVLSKISRLEDGTKSSALDTFAPTQTSWSAHDQPTVPIELIHADQGASANRLSEIPEQPKDRPFAHLVEVKTTIFPERFHVIMQSRHQTSQERAKLLRKVLWSDLRLLSVYLLLLVAFLVLTLYLALGGLDNAEAHFDWTLGYSWPTWNFAGPALILGLLMLWDAIQPPSKQGIDEVTSSFHHETRSFRPTATGLDAIQCNQIVNVVYTEEKDSDYEAKDTKRFYIDRSDAD